MKGPIQYIESFEFKEAIERIESDTLLVVIDEKVLELHSDKLHLDLVDKDVIFYRVTGGEDLKTFSELQKCLEFFLEKGVHRKSHLIAIGGGTVSDFAGLVASMLLRGISWSVIPTTLLGMVDAAIGGKVGINSKKGKNLIGDFYPPENIFTCLEFLSTLSLSEIQSGRGEILKYCLLDRATYNAVMGNRSLKDLIRTCADFKLKIVEHDIREMGARKILNLGHTFGHSFEVLQKLPHGIAVVLGIHLILRLFDQKEMEETLVALIDKLELVTPLDLYDKGLTPDQVFELVLKDKKRLPGDKIELISVRNIAYHVIEEISVQDLKLKFGDIWKNL